MAEGLLEGVLGGEEQKIDPTVSGTEPIVGAVAANVASQHPEVAADTAAMFRKQTEVLELQKKNLEAEYKFFESEAGPRLLALRLRTAFQVFFVLVATVIGLGFAMIIRDALTAHGAVIEAFSVPPDLAQRGLTGQVIAKQVLDQLSDMEAVASVGSARPANSYGTSWGNDLKVEVPETGISFGELRRLLYEALGHETRISGEVYATATGYTVTARDAERAGKAFSGRADELDALIRKAAESVFEQTQPYRFALYLFYADRRDESLPRLVRLTHDPNAVERAWSHVLISGNALMYDGDLARAAAENRAAVAEFPGHVRGFELLALTEVLRGHDAAAVEAAAQCLALKPENSPYLDSAWRDPVAASCLAIKSSAEGNFSEVARATVVRDRDPVRTWVTSRAATSVGPLVTHDLEAASAYDWEPVLTALIGSSGARRRIAEHRDSIAARIALERGDPRAVQLLTAVSASESAPGTPQAHDYMLRLSGAWLALAQARLGDLPAGQSLIAETPMDCRMCVDFRGRIAALARNAAEAERWFAQAIDMAPKLPQVYIDRGQTRLDRGDIAGALADATLSATLSSHDGDAWKLWGDVLVKQSQPKDALAKYDEALKYAPNWKQLKEAREAAAKAKT